MAGKVLVLKLGEVFCKKYLCGIDGFPALQRSEGCALGAMYFNNVAELSILTHTELESAEAEQLH